MRRVFRHVFTFFAGLSLLLGVAVSVLWVRSFRHLDLLDASYGHAPQPEAHHALSVEATSYAGALRLEVDRLRFGPAYFQGRPGHLEAVRQWYPNGWRKRPRGERNAATRRAGSRPMLTAKHDVVANLVGYHNERWRLAVPHGLAVVLLLVMPAVWVRRFDTRRRARRAGLCPSCGYDLRAHHAGEPCPECGTPAPASPASPASAKGAA